MQVVTSFSPSYLAGVSPVFRPEEMVQEEDHAVVVGEDAEVERVVHHPHQVVGALLLHAGPVGEGEGDEDRNNRYSMSETALPFT